MVGQYLGRYGELLFVMKAIENGLNVLHPDGQIGYDFVVEFNGKFTRVQIKTTYIISNDNRYRFDISSKSIGSDVYVFIILRESLFYMYHSDEVRVVQKTFTISTNKILDNCNNWNIFK
jgi:hypothetical protein